MLGFWQSSKPKVKVAHKDLKKEIDHVVRPQFENVLKPFPLAELPVELVLNVLSAATCCSQGTYRALLLTSRTIYAYTRLEMLQNVAIVLTTEHSLLSFADLLKQRPEVIPYVHALWTIYPGPAHHHARVCMDIIQACTSVRALAAHSHVLHYAFRNGPATLKHTRCVDLTLSDFGRSSWNAIIHYYPALKTLLNQIQRLHCVGAPDHVWSDSWPKLDNLTRLSIGMGGHKRVVPSLFRDVINSPKLKQVVITTRLRGEEQKKYAEEVQRVDARFSVLHRRRRWNEVNLFRETVQDSERFWEQAEAEKNVISL